MKFLQILSLSLSTLALLAKAQSASNYQKKKNIF